MSHLTLSEKTAKKGTLPTRLKDVSIILGVSTHRIPFPNLFSLMEVESVHVLAKLSIDNLETRISELEDSGTRNKELVDVCNFLAEKLLYNRVNFIRSRELCDKALELAIELDYKNGHGNALAQLGHNLSHVNKYGKARENLGAAVSIYESINDEKGLTYALNGLARLLMDFGKFGESIEIIQRVFELIEKLGDDVERIRLYDNISKIGFYLNDSKLPMEFHQDIILIEDSHLNYGRFYDHIGFMYFMDGDTENSLLNFQKAISESKKNGDLYAMATISSNFANVYYKIGDRVEAERQTRKAAKFMTEMGLDDPQIHALEDVVDNLFRMKDYAGALAQTKPLLLIAKNENNDYLYFKTLLKVACAEHRLGNLDRALVEINKVVPELAKFSGSDLPYKCHYLHVQVYEKQGLHREALESFHLYDKERKAFSEMRLEILRSISVIRTKVNASRQLHSELRERDIEIAKAYDEIAVHQTEI